MIASLSQSSTTSSPAFTDFSMQRYRYFRQAYGLNPNIRDYMNQLICKKCLNKSVNRESSTTDNSRQVDREIFLIELTG
jgi:hypothetical protein